MKCGDGYQGWPEAGPFNVIIVTAAPKEIPKELTEELKPNGRMVIPLGEFFQDLYLITRSEDNTLKQQRIISVRFVPMRKRDNAD